MQALNFSRPYLRRVDGEKVKRERERSVVPAAQPGGWPHVGKPPEGKQKVHKKMGIRRRRFLFRFEKGREKEVMDNLENANPQKKYRSL
ncbi:hypothetical protein RUM43_013639 [Polyplax serrata]|uniref:Uncharacterized protein n=1 Tax=Polyplax serrata TaxID=468196 RepID=A0AAN8P1X8_POLSC